MPKPQSSPKPLSIRLSPASVAILLDGLGTAVRLLKTSRASTLHDEIRFRQASEGYYSTLPDGSDAHQLSTAMGKLSALRSGGRWQPSTSFEIAACAFGIRVLSKLLRNGRQPAPTANFEVRTSRLFKRFEAARKRAKRTEIRQLGEQIYQQKAWTWKSFLQLLRVRLRGRFASQPKPPRANAWRAHVRTWLVRVTKLTADELRIRGEPIPQEADLRKYMRLALRYVRRGRTMFGVRTFVENQELAVNHFADFITVRVKKRNNKTGEKT